MNDKKKYLRTLMFSTKDDLYFIAYNVLAILKYMGCNGDKKFKDISKLAFMIDFISNQDLIRTLDKNNEGQNEVDKMLLSKAYSNGLMRINTVKRVLYSLNKYGIVEFEDNKKEVWLNETNKMASFFEDDFFEYERENVMMLKNRIQRLNVLTIDRFLDTTFSKKGVKSWASL